MLRERVKNQILRKQLIKPEDRILVAVSGGPDSIALLHILKSLSDEQGWEVAAAHLNHGFRGEESEADAEYVRSFCQQYDIPLEIRFVDVPKYMKETGRGAQESAREIRYEFLTEIAGRYHMSKIATGHHADDQIETILMRIIRGTGLDGLQGMPEIRKIGPVEVVRPLLSFRKQELEDYCREHDLNPRRDSSNESVKYTRNKVRLDVLPVLREINPGVDEAVLQLGEIAAEETHFMNREAMHILEKVMEQKDRHKMVINRTVLQEFDIALQRRVCKLILSCLFHNRNQNERTFSLISDILRFIRNPEPSGSIDIPGGYISKNYDRVVFSNQERRDKEAVFFEYVLNIPGETVIPETGHTFHARLARQLSADFRSQNIFQDERAAVFDWDQLEQPLKVRRRMPGDRIQLMNRGGKQKVKDVLINEKVPREQRDHIPVITRGDNRVIWIPGVKRSGEALVSSSTENFLIIEVE
ncbi:MAG: tRNA lysidine(34) synthetase TilS [Bacillaceae bacterium]|nr:tRNA lysidine(34) synthetase TilS [Bacillaceae bacterium]